MKFPRNSYSFAHAASELQFPGGALNFVYWLRNHRYLSGDLKPHQVCLKLGLFVNHTQLIPGPTKFQLAEIVIPRITTKGLAYFMSTLNQDGHNPLDLTTDDFSS